MKFTEEQMQTYLEFFRILGNIKKRLILEERQKKMDAQKQDAPNN